MKSFDFLGIEGLLSRLDGVKRTGPGKWIAKCPTRNERTASLSIKQTEDGSILLHDFGGSDAGEVITALGLSWIHLIPPHLRNNRSYSPAERQGHDAQAALNAIYGSAVLVRICGNKLLDGQGLDQSDYHALRRAVHDISTALDGVRGVLHG